MVNAPSEVGLGRSHCSGGGGGGAGGGVVVDGAVVVDIVVVAVIEEGRGGSGSGGCGERMGCVCDQRQSAQPGCQLGGSLKERGL